MLRFRIRIIITIENHLNFRCNLLFRRWIYATWDIFLHAIHLWHNEYICLVGIYLISIQLTSRITYLSMQRMLHTREEIIFTGVIWLYSRKLHSLQLTASSFSSSDYSLILDQNMQTLSEMCSMFLGEHYIIFICYVTVLLQRLCTIFLIIYYLSVCNNNT